MYYIFIAKLKYMKLAQDDIIPPTKPYALLRLMEYHDLTRTSATQIMPDTLIDMDMYMDKRNQYGVGRSLSSIDDDTGEWSTVNYRVAMMPMTTVFDESSPPDQRLPILHVYLIKAELFDLLPPLTADDLTTSMFPKP